jgi:hypothetical protein
MAATQGIPSGQSSGWSFFASGEGQTVISLLNQSG